MATVLSAVTAPAVDRLLTVKDACARLAVCRTTIAKLMSSGQLPSVKLGAARRVRESDVLALINGGAR